MTQRGSGEFRHPDKVQETALRRLIGKRCLTDREGLTVEDLDLVLRRFDPLTHGDAGRFRLIEHKMGAREVSMGQKMTFGLMDMLCRLADPSSDYYDGWYVLRTRPPRDDEDQLDYLDNVDEFKVNGEGLTLDQFIEWCNFGDIEVPSRPPIKSYERVAMRLMARLVRHLFTDQRQASLWDGG